MNVEPTSDPRPRRPSPPSLRADDFAPLGLDPPDPMPIVTIRTPTTSPFLFRKRIVDSDRRAMPGDLVEIRTTTRQLAGYGLFNPRSEIVLRMLTYNDRRPDVSWWQERFASAVQLRTGLLDIEKSTNAYRVIHAEGDGLSGLMVDRFADLLSIETFSWAMYRRAQAIASELSTLLGTSHWIVQPGPKMLGQEGFEPRIIRSEGCPEQVEINEHGTRFRVRLKDSHKTGYFCDQRENRSRLAKFCEDKRVLDLCCYSGGFAVQAKRLGNAREVTAVDLDENALALAKENANLNQLRIQFVHADAFAYMRDMLRLNRQYPVVVLDPPKLIDNRAEWEEGRKKHFDMCRLAAQLVEPGGLLLTCSCAGLLPWSEFEMLSLSAARQSAQGGRRVQVIARSGAAPDHPIAENCPETDYLKALWLRLN